MFEAPCMLTHTYGTFCYYVPQPEKVKSPDFPCILITDAQVKRVGQHRKFRPSAEITAYCESFRSFSYPFLTIFW